jgi:hypothetical protein
MVKVEPQVLGKKDDRLEYLLQQVKEGVSIFTEAVRKSSDEHESVAFKAFTLKTERKEEADAIFDVIMSAVAIELKTQAEDLISKFTFYHTHEQSEEAKEHHLFLFCRKVAPPTKEEIDKKMEEEIKANTVIDDDRTVAEVIKEASDLDDGTGITEAVLDIAGNEIPIGILQG